MCVLIVCVYTCVHVCMYVCDMDKAFQAAQTYNHVCSDRVYVRVYMYACTCAYVCMCVHICMCVYIHAYLSGLHKITIISIHKHASTQKYTCTHFRPSRENNYFYKYTYKYTQIYMHTFQALTRKESVEAKARPYGYMGGYY